MKPRLCLTPARALLGSFALIIASASAVFAADDSSEGLRIPAFTAYLTPDHNGARVSGDGIKRWRGGDLEINWYGGFKATGRIKAAVELRLPEGEESRLRLEVGRHSRVVTVKGSADGPVLADFGAFTIRERGYVKFTLGSRNDGGKEPGEVVALVLTGTPATTAHFNMKERRNAASVHLSYPVPGDPDVAAFYCEMTAVEDPIHTYYMATGWHRGYFGMQVNSETERRIIFSVWDSGGEAIDRNKVAKEDLVNLVAKGEGVYSGSFGNEGTGGHSHLKYMWKTGEKQYFVVTAKPVEKTFTIYSGYYFHPDKKEWMLISSWKAPRDGSWLRGLYSFSENFGGSTGHFVRKARYGNQWILTSEGEWQEITTAKFSHDGTGKADRLDRFMGVEDGEFFLSHGGFVNGYTKYGDPHDRRAKRRAPILRLPEYPGIPPLPTK